MPLLRSLANATATTVRAGWLVLRAARTVARRVRAIGIWLGRRVRTVRDRGAAGEPGMIRLFDLHAASCAADTLVTIGLAGTIFFGVPVGEARGRVALYLLVTMVPFALLAPVVGPVLDRFRHGRRYALATTMLGRAFLAWLIAAYLHDFWLYPAAFGVLALSRAYGVARSAAVPRLLPARLGMSEAGARASVYGTIAGALVTPIGLLTVQLGPQWTLRLASVIFVIGTSVALRLPPRADSDPPETVPRLWRIPWRRSDGPPVLAGRLVLAAVAGSAGLRALYGFLLLFLAFSIKAGDLPSRLAGIALAEETALGVVGAALATGTFLATAIGTRLRIRRPLILQAAVLVLVAVLAVLSTTRLALSMIIALCLATAIASGLAKLAVDATIQERIPEQVRASAFAHAETLLMLAWVAGGAVGLIPFDGRLGVGLAGGFAVLAALRAVVVAGRLRRERLYGGAPPSTADPAAGHTKAARLATSVVANLSLAASVTADPSPTTSVTANPSLATGFGTADSQPAQTTATSGHSDSLAPHGFHLYRPSGQPSEPKAGSDR